jgi:hypothetical protein
MQTVKAIAVRHAEEFTRDPAGKVFGTAIDLFFFSLALTFAIWVARGAWGMVYGVLQ